MTLGALVYLYVRHNGSFYFVRNMFIVSWVIALAGYALFPTAPPRFFPEWGFVDSVADFTGVRPTARRPMRSSIRTPRSRRCTSRSR